MNGEENRSSEDTNLFSVFNKRDCVLWTRDKKRYVGEMEIAAKGEFLVIAQNDVPCPAAALIRLDDVLRVELRRKRDFYRETEATTPNGTANE